LGRKRDWHLFLSRGDGHGFIGRALCSLWKLLEQGRQLVLIRKAGRDREPTKNSRS